MSKLSTFVHKLRPAKKFKAEKKLAERIINCRSTAHDDRLSDGVFVYPTFLQKGSLFSDYPGIDFVILDEELRNTKWEGFVGWSLLHELMRMYDSWHLTEKQENRLKKVIIRTTEKNPEVFIDGVLIGQERSVPEYRKLIWREYVQGFSTPEILEKLLKRPEIKNPENRLVLAGTLSALQHWEAYEYIGYPTEWLGSIYDATIEDVIPWSKPKGWA